MNKPVLLLIYRLLSGGGTEAYVLTLASELKRNGHQVGVFTSGGPWVGLFRQHGIRVHVSRFQASSLERIVSQHGYQIVHANDSVSIGLIQHVRFTQPASVFFTVHGRYVNPRLLKLGSIVARGVIAVSPSLYQYALHCGVPSRKLHWVPNGISTRTFRPMDDGYFRRKHRIPDNAFVIGYAGRFTFDKTTMGKRICSVLRSYAEAYPNTYVLVAGRHSIDAVPGNGRVIVLGHVGNMARFYNNCNVVVGTARVALESLACGKPTIAVGYAGYMGIVTSQNLRLGNQTNFGDHGAFRESWTNQQLIRDLETVQLNRTVLQGRGKALAKTIRLHYSGQRMVAKIQLLYQ